MPVCGTVNVDVLIRYVFLRGDGSRINMKEQMSSVMIYAAFHLIRSRNRRLSTWLQAGERAGYGSASKCLLEGYSLVQACCQVAAECVARADGIDGFNRQAFGSEDS